MLNAINPLKVSGTAEPWRQWLMEIEFDKMELVNCNPAVVAIIYLFSCCFCC